MKTLITRSKTALIFVAVMLGGIWWNQWSYMVLMLAIMSFSVWEYYKVMAGVVGKNLVSSGYKYISVAFGFFYFFSTFNPIVIPENTFFDRIFLILELFADSKTPFQNAGINVLAFFYVSFPLALLNFVVFQNESYQAIPLISILLMIWANDAFAYLVGSAIGKHKMFPRISPGKTWEGTIGGIAGNFIVAFLIFKIFNLYTLRDWLVIAAIVSIFATLGDLVESMLKRSLNIKDTGSLFPGHGGMLDRFDAFFFAIPFVALYFYFMKNSF
jgi:phosphatidate cytidylyltransferase